MFDCIVGRRACSFVMVSAIPGAQSELMAKCFAEILIASTAGGTNPMCSSRARKPAMLRTACVFFLARRLSS
jgi:hypothetical protein